MALPSLFDTPTELDRLYLGLPEHYRVADEQSGFTLYRWLAGPGAVFGNVADTIDSIDYRDTSEGGPPGDTSDLADPTTAPDVWLPWLAQLVGVAFNPALSETERRDAVRYASAGWRAGTKSAVADAARTALVGTRYAGVFDHSVFEPGDGGEWDVLIVTRGTETPDAAAVLAAVVRRGAKPAGVVLHHRVYETSWDTVSSTFPTWTALEAAGSWDAIQEAGLT